MKEDLMFMMKKEAIGEASSPMISSSQLHPFSPDFAPSDFHLFLQLKEFLRNI